MILRAGENFGNAEDDVAGEAHDFFIDAQHQGNHIGLAGSQAHARAVRLITQLSGDHAHPLLGLGSDIRGILQCARNGGDP